MSAEPCRFDSLKLALVTIADSRDAVAVVQDAAPGVTVAEVIAALQQLRRRVVLWDDGP